MSEAGWSASETATARAARTHARAQAGGAAEAMPVLPASSAAFIPPAVEAGDVVWAETVAGGGYSSKWLARGTTVRLTDRDGDACAHVLLYSAVGTWERLNPADTVKVPWQAYLGQGHPLLSDQGRVLATIVGDTSGRHDALCGTSCRALNAERYGDGSAGGVTPAGRELLALAACKHGLERRDLAPSVSFFKGVRVDEDGDLVERGGAKAGAWVELRAEMPLVILLANVPHPLDTRAAYTCSPLQVVAWRGHATAPTDELWSSTPELERAFLNTSSFLAAGGVA